jgi:N-acetylmuramoyl-L-alanine amidase
MKKIYIHQGHSEADSGAEGADGYKESDYTKAVGEKLATKLRKAGYTAYLSRERLPQAESRVVAADTNELGVDLVVSIHANDVDDTSVHGAEVFITGMSQRAKDLAEATRVSFDAAFPGRKWRKIALDTETKAGSLAILRVPKAPAMLFESGFLSNAEELAWLESEDEQDKVAGVLFAAITRCVKEDTA